MLFPPANLSATLPRQVLGDDNIGVEKIDDITFTIDYFSYDAVIDWSGATVAPHPYDVWHDAKHFS